MKNSKYSGKYAATQKKNTDAYNEAKGEVGQTCRKLKKPFLVIFCALLVCTGIVFVFANFLGNDSKQSAAATEPSVAITEASTEATVPEETTVPTATTVPEETEPPVKEIMPKYQELYERNPEFFGYLTIEGTNINYPVMHSLEDNEKYLHADFDGNYRYAGIPYVDKKCSPDSDNLLVYGHNMLDGSMFATLFNYEDEEFWKEHPTFMFSDLYEDYEYEVMAVFRDRIYKKSDTCFKFYFFIDAENETDFDYAISELKKKSIYDTGVVAEYGDQLITLITCAYHTDNGRFVVVARRK